jgi:LacI family transcriptional regulator
VLIGNRLDSVGVPSVLADDAQAIRLAVEYLRAAGHEKIALVSDDPDHANDRVQIAAWRSCFAGMLKTEEIERRLIVVSTPDYESLMQHTYQAVRRYLSSKHADATALICLIDEMTIATLAACRDSGRPVPDQMSVINSGNSSLMQFAHPAVTCIDVHIDQHIEQAMEMLEAAMENRLLISDRLRLVMPHLVERHSVSKLR